MLRVHIAVDDDGGEGSWGNGDGCCGLMAVGSCITPRIPHSIFDPCSLDCNVIAHTSRHHLSTLLSPSHAVVEVGLARAPSGLHPQPAMGPVAGGRNADAAAAAPGAAGRRHCAAMVYGDGVLLVGVDSPQVTLTMGAGVVGVLVVVK